jgi:membrane protein YqaA with SNARE-associated domain
MMYVVVFLSSLAVDLIPVVAPPAWMIMVFLQVKFDLNPWGVLAAGVPGSTLGRYLLSLYIPKFSKRFIKQHKKEELEYVGSKLNRSLWRTWTFTLLYTMTPLSSTALFTAAGIAKVNPLHVVPPFFVGKFISDAILIFSGHYAAGQAGDLFHGTVSWKGILTAVIGLVVVGAFLFIDWHALLARKKLKFNFNIWK